MRTVIAAAVLLSLAVVGDVPAAKQEQERPVIRISAERFSFTPSRITLAVGDEVEIRITSQDTAHGFRIVGSETDVIIPKRGSGEASVIFRADKAGRLTFECSRMCGAGHNFMRGEIVVEPRGGREQ